MAKWDGNRLAFWKRALATLVAMLAASVLVGLAWHSAFGAPIPSYLAGVAGGITALVVWEFLKNG